jgi:hypothetical protein
MGWAFAPSFAELAARRRATRSSSLLEQLSRVPGHRLAGHGHQELACARKAMQMTGIEEKHRLDEDKETVLLLLKQVLGVGVVGNLVDTAQ